MTRLTLHLVPPRYSARHFKILYSRQSISLIGSRPIRTVHNISQHHGIAAFRNPHASNLY